MEGTVNIDGTEYKLKASAATVMHYRDEFGRDLLTDMGTIEVSALADGKIVAESIGTAEKVAYIMHKDATGIEKSLEEWLEDKEPTFIYRLLPGVIRAWRGNNTTIEKLKKKLRRTEREWNTALFLLRITQMGLSTNDLDNLTIGMIMDMWTELSNDKEEYAEIADQDDFNAF